MNDRIVGLDIGYSKIRAAQVDRGFRGGARVDVIYEIEIPDAVIALGEIVDKKAFVALLVTLWQKAGFDTKKVALAAANMHVFSRELTIPAMSRQRILESLPFMMEGVLPVPAESLLLDFYPALTEIGDSGPTLRGLVVAVEKSNVEQLIDAVTQAKLVPVSVDFIPFALARVHLSENKETGLIALVDVGAITSSVIIAMGTVPLFVRVIPNGGQDVNRALIAHSQLTSAEADSQKYKISKEPSKKSEAKADVWNVVKDATEELAKAVKSTIEYFEQEHPASTGLVEHILLSGGGSQLALLPGVVEEVCKIPVQLSRGIPHIRVKPPLNAENPDFDKMAVAIGLTLGVNS